MASLPDGPLPPGPWLEPPLFDNVFAVIGENTCCGCAEGVLHAIFATREAADRYVKDYVMQYGERTRPSIEETVVRT